MITQFYLQITPGIHIAPPTGRPTAHHKKIRSYNKIN